MELKNFNIFGIYWKIWVLGGRVHEIQYKGRDYLKSGLGKFADLKGTWQEKRGGGGCWYPNAHFERSEQSQNNDKPFSKEMSRSYHKE